MLNFFFQGILWRLTFFVLIYVLLVAILELTYIWDNSPEKPTLQKLVYPKHYLFFGVFQYMGDG